VNREILNLESPSGTLIGFADELRSLSQWPVLDAGCGFGRNAVALALRGISVVCIDRDADRLGTLFRLGPSYIASHRGLSGTGELYPICADLNVSRWPFDQKCFAAIICVHFLRNELLEAFRSSLVPGGYLYIETFGGHGRNYVDLPKAGQLRNSLSPYFEFKFYRERSVGPPGCGAVSVKLFGKSRRDNQRIVRSLLDNPKRPR
jgi:SAM-dependent methyltransferase